MPTYCAGSRGVQCGGECIQIREWNTPAGLARAIFSISSAAAGPCSAHNSRSSSSLAVVGLFPSRDVSWCPSPNSSLLSEPASSPTPHPDSETSSVELPVPSPELHKVLEDSTAEAQAEVEPDCPEEEAAALAADSMALFLGALRGLTVARASASSHISSRALVATDATVAAWRGCIMANDTGGLGSSSVCITRRFVRYAATTSMQLFPASAMFCGSSGSNRGGSGSRLGASGPLSLS